MKKVSLAILFRTYSLSRFRVFLIAPTVPFIVASCANLYEPVPLISDLKEQSVVSSTSSLSYMVVRRSNSNLIICTQPQPDSAFDQGEAADFSLLSLGGSDQVGEDSSSDEVEMAGRTPALLMTRELFYRACEFSENQKLTKEEALALYSKTLDAVTHAWNTEAENTKVTIGDTITTTSGTTLQNTTADALTSTATKSDTASITDSK